jgi:hypothetical protein
MKKPIFAVAGSLLMTVSMFAQATVSFQNGANTAFYFGSVATANKVTSAPLNQQPQAQSASTGVLDVGLYWSATPFSDLSSGTLAGIENIGTTPGLLAGNSSFGIAGTSPNDVVYIQIYAWDSSYGNSQAGLEACYAADGIFMACSTGLNNNDDEFIGAPIRVTLGVAGGPGTPLFGSGANMFGQTLYSTPEPASIAIGSLGAAALVFFHRRRK